jgi:hypothetical protein
MPQGTTIINFGSFPGASDATVTVTGQTPITAGALVEAWIMPAATADHSADEHMVETIAVVAGNVVAGVGFTIYGINIGTLNEFPLGWLSSGQQMMAIGAGGGMRLYGQWTVAWAWLN